MIKASALKAKVSQVRFRLRNEYFEPMRFCKSIFAVILAEIGALKIDFCSRKSNVFLFARYQYFWGSLYLMLGCHFEVD